MFANQWVNSLDEMESYRSRGAQIVPFHWNDNPDQSGIGAAMKNQIGQGIELRDHIARHSTASLVIPVIDHLADLTFLD